MALPIVFGNITATSGPLSELDQNFNALGVLITNVGTVTGTNSIVFTPAANNPAIASYSNYLRFGFVAANTSTGSVTFQYAALAAVNYYKADDATQAGSGDIVAGRYYEVVFNSALNSGSGGVVQVSAVPTSGGGGTFPSGTIMLFQQTAAPTGWTKLTALNDVGLRIVSGTAGSVTNQTAFSTVFTQTATGATTLSTSQIPSHTHPQQSNTIINSSRHRVFLWTRQRRQYYQGYNSGYRRR